MDKLYNTQKDLTSSFKIFLASCISNIRKTQLNIIPFILFGMIMSESCSATDIAKSLKEEFSLIKYDSVVKRIRRFFSNKLFKPYDFYKKFIMHVLNTYKKKHNDKRVHITFDHMFSHNNYTVFMISMRVGTQGIPLWFKCFKGGKDTAAFKIETLKEGIKAVSDLFAGKDFDLIFLADRWFAFIDLLEFIDQLGHTYCIRLKGNISVYKDNQKMCAKHLAHYKNHSAIHNDVYITKHRYKTNIVYSKTSGTKDPWIIVTNGDATRAIKDYGYRFGSIESIFKNQKTNGFNLEKITNDSVETFTIMYTMVCTCVTYLTIIGADYSKNTNLYKKVKFETHKTYNVGDKKIKKRIKSLFDTGLTLFKIAFNSLQYIRIPFSFILYDI